MPSDFAASKAALNFAPDEMSGFAAPFCTASAMAERAMSAPEPGTSLPCWVRSLRPWSVTIATSVSSPSATILVIRAEGPKENESLLPVARSKSGASSSSDVFMAVVASTLISDVMFYPGSRPLAFMTACAAGVARNLMSARAASGCLPLAGMPAVR